MVENCLQSDLTSVATWLGSSCLCLNVDKSTCILIGSRQRVKGWQVVPFLSQLVVVCCLRYILFSILVYWLTLGLCHLWCCVCYIQHLWCHFLTIVMLHIWIPSTAKQTCLIERVHSKFIHELPSFYHSKFPFTLTEHCQCHTAIQIFKSLHQISPPYLHDILKFPKDVTGCFSRVVNLLLVPRVFTNYGKQSFYYWGIVLWNTLKSTVTGAVTLLPFWNCYLNSCFSVFVILLLFVVSVLCIHFS